MGISKFFDIVIIAARIASSIRIFWYKSPLSQSFLDGDHFCQREVWGKLVAGYGFLSVALASVRFLSSTFPGAVMPS